MKTLLLIFLATVAVGQAKVEPLPVVIRGDHYYCPEGYVPDSNSNRELCGVGQDKKGRLYATAAVCPVEVKCYKSAPAIESLNGVTTDGNSRPDPTPKQMLIAPMGLQDGDICIVRNNTCTKIEGGNGIITTDCSPHCEYTPIKNPSDVSQAISDYKERLKAGGVTREVMDVPAVKEDIGRPDVTAYPCGILGGAMCLPIQEGPPYRWTCTDKRRIKLQSEDGEWHCILFPKESK